MKVFNEQNLNYMLSHYFENMGMSADVLKSAYDELSNAIAVNTADIYNMGNKLSNTERNLGVNIEDLAYQVGQLQIKASSEDAGTSLHSIHDRICTLEDKVLTLEGRLAELAEKFEELLGADTTESKSDLENFGANAIEAERLYELVNNYLDEYNSRREVIIDDIDKETGTGTQDSIRAIPDEGESDCDKWLRGHGEIYLDKVYNLLPWD